MRHFLALIHSNLNCTISNWLETASVAAPSQ